MNLFPVMVSVKEHVCTHDWICCTWSFILLCIPFSFFRKFSMTVSCSVSCTLYYFITVTSLVNISYFTVNFSKLYLLVVAGTKERTTIVPASHCNRTKRSRQTPHLRVAYASQFKLFLTMATYCSCRHWL